MPYYFFSISYDILMHNKIVHNIFDAENCIGTIGMQMRLTFNRPIPSYISIRHMTEKKNDELIKK